MENNIRTQLETNKEEQNKIKGDIEDLIKQLGTDEGNEGLKGRITELEQAKQTLEEKQGELTEQLKGISSQITTNQEQQQNALNEHTKLLDEYRAQVGVEIFARGAASELLAASRALKKGRILGFLADQDAGPGGAFIEFLGEVCSTPMGPAVFARKFMSPVVPAFIIRQSDGTHKIEIYEPIVYNDTGDTNADLYDFTERMTKVIEEQIIAHPTQWIWFQKRWNTRPEQQKVKHHTVKTKVVNTLLTR